MSQDKPQTTEPCVWTLSDPDEGVWATACGWAFMLTLPTEHRMRFCCYCGAPLATEAADAKPMKVVTFRRPQGVDRITIPAGDDPEKHVRPELILRVQEVKSDV